MKFAAALPTLAALLILPACSEAPDSRPVEAETPIPVEPGGGIGDGATPLSGAGEAIRTTMPNRLRGEWRADDLGRAPTREDCNQTSGSNRNFGKVLTISSNGFSLFEQGGRIVDIHTRTDSMIDATFDTTYADTPTTARMDFALQPGGTLAVNDDDGDGTPSVTQYRPCPEE